MGKFFALLARIWEVLARRVDSYLMAAALAIVGIGLITLFSASDQNIARVTSQVVSLGFALVLMWVVANIPPQQLARAALPLYVVGVLLLIAVALGGTVVNGSRRWLNFGFARFRPRGRAHRRAGLADQARARSGYRADDRRVRFLRALSRGTVVEDHGRPPDRGRRGRAADLAAPARLSTGTDTDLSRSDARPSGQRISQHAGVDRARLRRR